MKQLSTKVEINASADEVYAYVTDVNHMPDFLPFPDKVTPVGEGKVRVQGKMSGQPFDKIAWFKADKDARTMQWGATTRNEYSGEMAINDLGDHSELAIDVRLGKMLDMSESDRKEFEAHVPDIQTSLDQIGQTIKQQCEGTLVPADEKKHGWAR